jgi:DNA-binding NarL/FixJ family response regulator
MRRIRVFLVDDHLLFLAGVQAELGREFEVVGAASDVVDAIEGIRTTRPDVTLLDVHMPEGGGASGHQIPGALRFRCA